MRWRCESAGCSRAKGRVRPEYEQMRKQIEKVLEMLSPDFNWKKHWEKQDAETLQEAFKKCVKLVSSNKSKNYHDCGSYKAEDTPRGMYRLFYLLEPKEVDFTNMYRGELFSFVSADERFLVKVCLFEYELGLYFLAQEDLVDKSEGVCVPAAWPGADNKVSLVDPLGVDFFEMIKLVVEHKFEVYPVGEFVV
jgi:hypothetical protein